MTIAITPVDNGTVEGDDTGESAFNSFESINANEAALKAAGEELQGRFWTPQNALLTLALGKRYMANAHAGFAWTAPAVFAASTTAESDIWGVNNDDASNITLTPTTGDSFFVKGVTLGVSATQVIAPGEMFILSIRADNVSWDLTILGGGGSSGGLVATYKTANYTAVAGDFVIIDLGGVARTITLPATIAMSDRIAIHAFNTSATPVLCTVARNAHIIRYQGDSTGADVTLDDGETVELIASGATNMEIV